MRSASRTALVAVALLTVPVVTVTLAACPDLSNASTMTAYPPTATSPLRILTVGDSMVYGADGGTLSSFRRQLDRDLNTAGVPHEFRVEAVGGQTCQYFADRINAYLTTHQPVDVLITWCGKNDARLAIPRASTRAALKTIAASAIARGVSGVYFANMNYSNPVELNDMSRVDREADVNNAVVDATNIDYPYVTAMLDLTMVPGDGVHLVADGVHLTERGEDAVGREMYRHYIYNFVRGPQLPSMCGMYGHWRGNPRPAFTPCTVVAP